MADEAKPSGGQGDTKPAEGTTEKPAEGAKPVEAAKPAEGAKPVEAEKPAEAAKPAEGEKPAEAAKPEEKKPEEKPAGAPAKYDIKIPDGMRDLLDDADLKDLEGKARAKGLTNEQLQGVVTARAEELAAQSAAFRAQTESDPIVGGDQLPETQRLSKIAMDRLHPESTPEGKDFRSFLKKTGYGNHVQVVKHFATLGKLMAEDGHVQGGGTKTSQTAASVLYDKTPPSK